jgi:hypothetical protein
MARSALECFLASQCFDGHIDTASLGQALDGRNGIAVLRVERDVCSKSASHFQPIGIGIDPDDETLRP